MVNEPIAEREVITPTVAALRLVASDRSTKGRRPYLFVISEDDLHKLRKAQVSVSACVVYAAICGAVRAARTDDWVTLPSRTIDALHHSFRWWWRQTEALERAGVIEVKRHQGRLPRYRLAMKPSELQESEVPIPRLLSAHAQEMPSIWCQALSNQCAQP